MEHISLFEAMEDSLDDVLTEDEVRQGYGAVGDRVVLDDEIGEITYVGYIEEGKIPNWKFSPGYYALVLMSNGSFWSIPLNNQ